MKTLITFLLLIATLSCTRQENKFRILGEIENIPDSLVIELKQYNDDLLTEIGTDTILNGRFEFSGFAKTNPTKMQLSFTDRTNYYGSCKVWVSNENIIVMGANKYPSSWTVKSKNKEQQAYNKIRNHTKWFTVASDSLRIIRAQNRSNKELRNKIKVSLDSISTIRRKEEIKIIENNPNSLSAVEMLYRIAKFDKSIEKQKIKSIYNCLQEEYKNTLYGQGIKETFMEKVIPEIGDKMVDFIAHDTLGVNYSLSDFKGKYILLDFWHLGCGPCLAAFPETVELHENNKDILTIVGVNLFADEEMWKEKSRDEGICWINLSDGKGTYAGAYAKYGILGMPTYILINPEGIIIEKWMGYGEGTFKKLEKHIENIKV